MTFRRFLQLMSLANLIFLPVWVEITPGSGPSYFMGYVAGGWALAALACNLILLMFLLEVGFRFVQGKQGRAWAALRVTFFFTVTGLCINGTRVALQDQAVYFNLAHQALQLGWPKFLCFFGTPFLLLAWWIVVRERAFLVFAGRIGLIFSPLVLVLSLPFLQAVPPGHPLPIPLVTPKPGLRAGPVLLFIFDEWDYSWTFPYRPAGMRLPELDRFVQENITFQRAYPPTNETIRSIPSLLIGKPVLALRTAPGSDLRLQLEEGSGWTRWSETPDLPYRLGTLGLRTCFINHFHRFDQEYLRSRPLLEIRRTPYFTEWETGATRYQTLSGSLLRQWVCLLENIPGGNYLLNHAGKVNSVPNVYRHALRETLEAISSRRFDLVVVHWPIPHAPVIADPDTGELSERPTPKGLRLLTNLHLLDRTLGQIRRALEAQGLWESATLILTSDHWQRYAADPRQGLPPTEPGVPESGHRVPLLIKCPALQGPRNVTAPVNNVLVAPFVEAVLTGKSSPEAVLESAAQNHPWWGAYSRWIK